MNGEAGGEGGWRGGDGGGEREAGGRDQTRAGVHRKGDGWVERSRGGAGGGGTGGGTGPRRQVCVRVCVCFHWPRRANKLANGQTSCVVGQPHVERFLFRTP